MNPLEIKRALEGMVVICDSREQDTPRLRARLKQTGCKVKRDKLDFGDYSARFPVGDDWISLSSVVAIERKMSIDELAHCYCQGRKRFAAEFERAKVAGAKLYLLVEDATMEKILSGTYRSHVSASSLVASIFAWLARYDCQIIFCRPESSGRVIREILYREGKERMEQDADG